MKYAQKFATALAMTFGITSTAQAATTITIATVNNSDMIVMEKLSSHFEAENPDIKLHWVTLEENVLRQRVTTDIATHSGQLDLITVGIYEVPIWGKLGWLSPFTNIPASYQVEDLLKPIRNALTVNGSLDALPFYGESTFTIYRTDLFKAKNLTIELAARQPSCLAFVGPTLDRLVITSASKGLDASVVSAEPLNGAIFIGTPTRGRGLLEARYGHGKQA